MAFQPKHHSIQHIIKILNLYINLLCGIVNFIQKKLSKKRLSTNKSSRKYYQEVLSKIFLIQYCRHLWYIQNILQWRKRAEENQDKKHEIDTMETIFVTLYWAPLYLMAFVNNV